MLDNSLDNNTEEKRLRERLLGHSTVIEDVRSLVLRVSKTDVHVLVTGASGTGKELVAKNLHNFSKRKSKPFVAINCGAVPSELLESELFGHEKGAFTGAFTARQGRFELAEGGTLFLDEIGDMPLHMQVKLLRVLQERSYERVGGIRSHPCNVRIISATHRNLEQLIEEGRFREDLYYRLNVFPIHLPKLVDHIEDMEVLMKGILLDLNQQFQTKTKISEEAIYMLKQYDWPGNVRELSNLLERLIVLYPEEIIYQKHLPEKYRKAQSHSSCSRKDPVIQMDLKEYLSQLECAYIRKALEASGGVVAKAAESLGLRRTTLVEKMKKYEICA